MMVCVEYGGCHTEIATAFSKPRNDEFVNTTLCPICHCEGRRPVAIHQPPIVNTKTENKKKKNSLYIKNKSKQKLN